MRINRETLGDPFGRCCCSWQIVLLESESAFACACVCTTKSLYIRKKSRDERKRKVAHKQAKNGVKRKRLRVGVWSLVTGQCWFGIYSMLGNAFLSYAT